MFNVVERLLDKLPRRRKLRFWRRIETDDMYVVSRNLLLGRLIFMREMFIFSLLNCIFAGQHAFSALFPLISYSNKSICVKALCILVD